MKLLSAAQIRMWDQYTLQKEPITSIQLMERAAKACAKWIVQHTIAQSFYIFCGKGNNGGDGLAIGRLLADAHKNVKIYILESEANASDDFIINFNHLHQKYALPITLLHSPSDYPPIPQGAVVVDALFGTGLNRQLSGIAASLVQFLNENSTLTIAIDMPSGMLSDAASAGGTVVRAHHTLTFQCLKMAFLMPENTPYFGLVHIMDINLHPDFLESIETKYKIINKNYCESIYKKRNNFSHKGNFGHGMLIAGSYGKMGAAVLSAKACMKSGIGLLTTKIPATGMVVMQATVPEAMCEDSSSPFVQSLHKYSSIGIGPGLGTEGDAVTLLHTVLQHYTQPMVIDADALNILATHPAWMNLLPANTILTPHPKEFARLFGAYDNDYEKVAVALAKASLLGVIIVLKGHHTFIATPHGGAYFNITGNAGMATAGSGDVLTGFITGLLAQGYTPQQAATLGVFLHGLAGDVAAAACSMEAMTASDIIAKLGDAFSAISY